MSPSPAGRSSPSRGALRITVRPSLRSSPAKICAMPPRATGSAGHRNAFSVTRPLGRSSGIGSLAMRSSSDAITERHIEQLARCSLIPGCVECLSSERVGWRSPTSDISVGSVSMPRAYRARGEWPAGILMIVVVVAVGPVDVLVLVLGVLVGRLGQRCALLRQLIDLGDAGLRHQERQHLVLAQRVADAVEPVVALPLGAQ